MAEAGYDLEQEVFDLTTAERVREAVAKLPGVERKAIELAYFGGHSYREVAVIENEPEGTIKSRIRSGLRRMGPARRGCQRDRPMMHGEIEELLGAYALHATEPEEDREIEAHLADCPRCRAEVQAHLEVAAMLGSSASEVPAGLWEKIAASVGEIPLPGPPTSCPSCTPLARFPLCDNEAPDAGR